MRLKPEEYEGVPKIPLTDLPFDDFTIPAPGPNDIVLPSHEPWDRVGLKTLQFLQMPTLDVPQQVFHYTTVSALRSIVEGRNLWFTHVAYLNDTSEYMYGYGLLSQVIDEVLDTRWGASRSFLEELRDKMRPENLQFEFFVACFCAHGDRLSQWRSYGSATDAYALGFDITSLSNVRKSVRIVDTEQRFWPFTKSLHRVSYNRASHMDLVRENVTAGVDWFELLRATVQDTQQVDAARIALVNLEYRLIQVFPVIKNPAFEEEEEWRMVVVASREVDSEGASRGTRYRPVRGMLVPYLPVVMEMRDGTFPLSSVRLGPGGSPLALQSVRAFLNEQGFPLVAVEQSSIPYRGDGAPHPI